MSFHEHAALAFRMERDLHEVVAGAVGLRRADLKVGVTRLEHVVLRDDAAASDFTARPRLALAFECLPQNAIADVSGASLCRNLVLEMASLQRSAHHEPACGVKALVVRLQPAD